MTQRKPRNLTASVHDRLLQLARQRQEDFQAVLMRYGLERFLYRLSRSPHREAFILKGALLFALWSDRPQRPTKDLDLLGRGDSSLERLEELFPDLCHQPVEEDGLTFQVSPIFCENQAAGWCPSAIGLDNNAHTGNGLWGFPLWRWAWGGVHGNQALRPDGENAGGNQPRRLAGAAGPASSPDRSNRRRHRHGFRRQ